MAQLIENPEQISVASGTTDAFPTVFTFEDAAEVEVQVDVGTGFVPKVLGVDYDLTGADWLNAGGTVVFRAGKRPPADARVWRRRKTRLIQPDAFGDTETFRPQLSEGAHDRAVRMVQDLSAQLERAVTVPPGSTPPSPETLKTLGEGIAGVLQQALQAGGSAGAAAAAAQLGTVAAQALQASTDADQASLDAAQALLDAGEALERAAAAEEAAQTGGGAGKASLTGDTFTGPVAVEVPETEAALLAGTEHGKLAVKGAAPVPAFVADPNLYQDVSRRLVEIQAQGDDGTLDLLLLPRGKGGRVRTNRMAIHAKTFGQRDNLVGLAILTNEPDEEEFFTIAPGQISPGPPGAGIFGITGGPGIGNYPDIDQCALYVKPYGTRDMPVATTGYTATTVTLAQPLPEDHDLELTSTLQTATTPWYRGVLIGISSDRRTLTVYGWAIDKGAEGIGPAPQFDGAPPGNPGLYLNPFTKGFGCNIVMELAGPVWRLVSDVPGQSPTDHRLAWYNPSGVFVPYPAGDSPTARRPSNAPAGSFIGQKLPAYFQDNMYVGEINVVNTKGHLDYKGTLQVNDPITGELFDYEGLRGCKNFAAGLDAVMPPCEVPNPQTGVMERTKGAFAFRSRGPFMVGYEALEAQDYGFRVQRGFAIPSKAGFAYEAGHSANTATAFLVAPAKDRKWSVNAQGDMKIGSSTVAGARIIEWFTNGDATRDASLTVTSGGIVEFDASAFVFRGPGFSKRMTLSDTGVTFGPDDSNWLFFQPGSARVFRVGHPGTALLNLTDSMATVNSPLSVGKNSPGLYSLLVATDTAADATVSIFPGVGSIRPSIRADGAAARIPLALRGKAAGFIIPPQTVVANGDADAASKGCEIGEVYINTANGTALTARIA